MKSEKEKAEAEEHRDERIEKTGQITLQDHAGGTEDTFAYDHRRSGRA